MSVFFASIPLRDSLLYFYGDAKIFAHLSVFSLLSSIFTGFIFIRPFGPVAAAASFLIIQIISVVILFTVMSPKIVAHTVVKNPVGLVCPPVCFSFC